MKQECPTAVENTAIEQFRAAIEATGFTIEGLPDHLSAAQAVSLAQSLIHAVDAYASPA